MNYEVQVGGMTASGTVTATIAAGKVHDAAGNANLASTSTDNTVQYTNAWAIYNGTNKDDSIMVSPGAAPGTWQVVVNSTIWNIPATMQGITINGLGGNNKIKLVGKASNDTFQLWSDHAVFTCGNFEVDITNVQTYTVDGAGGNNTAYFHDGANPNAVTLVNVQNIIMPQTSFAIGDVNGSGTADLVWQDPSTGTVGAWVMQTGAASTWTNIGTANPQLWKVVGTGDFNHDGTADLLLFNQVSGDFLIDFMHNGAIASTTLLGTANPAIWKPLAIGDFNGDGTADLALQNQSSGDVVVDLIANGPSPAARRSARRIPPPGNSPASATLSSDNGNGTADLLWQNQIDGTYLIDVMSNGAISNTPTLGTANPAVWQPAGVGDFNGDGTADLALQNRSSGAVVVDVIKNGAISSTSVIGTANPALWQPAGVGDLNGNGTQDILWRNTTTGSISVDFMQNGAVGSFASVGAIDPSVRYDTPNGSYLHADSVVAPAAGVQTLTQSELQPIIQEAITRWKDAGMNAATLAQLAQAQFEISDLPGTDLGETQGNVITIDVNAAGHGWFVDPTPATDEEFTGTGAQLQAIDPRAVDKIDLLTVVEHELGHVAGFDDLDATAQSVMDGVLGVGIRREIQ